MVTLRARSDLLVGHLFQPFLPRSAGRVKLRHRAARSVVTDDRALDVLALVLCVTKQTGPQIHLIDPRKGLLREIWIVEHGNFAILLLHLRDNVLLTNIAVRFEDVTDGITVGGDARHLLFVRQWAESTGMDNGFGTGGLSFGASARWSDHE